MGAWSLAESLDTRGFHPTAPRTEGSLGRLPARDGVLLGLYGAATAAAFAARAACTPYGADLSYDPA